MGGWVSTHWHWVGGEGGGFKKRKWGPARLLLPVEGKLPFARGGRNSGPATHKGCICPLAALPRRRRQCSTQSLSQDRGVPRVLTITSDVRNATSVCVCWGGEGQYWTLLTKTCDAGPHEQDGRPGGLQPTDETGQWGVSERPVVPGIVV